MKTGLSVLVLGAAMVFGAVHANAADLINEDDVPYTVIVDGDMEVAINAGEELKEICKACTIQLADSDEEPVAVDEATALTISKGKLVIGN